MISSPTEVSPTEGKEYTFSNADFDRVRALIRKIAGISLNSTKQNMVYSRLSRRLRTTGHVSFKNYLDELEARQSDEWQEFTNALTTNLTSFFREEHHFPILAEFIRARAQPVKIWCAAASTGEEPYSLAMVMSECATGGATNSKLLATDIDTNVLETASNGVYAADGHKGLSESRRNRFFLKGTGANAGKIRVRPELRKLVEFAPLNLLANEYAVPLGLDAVFCRNVLIYFDKPTQHLVLARLARHLKVGGLLFAGHSENFSDCRDIFKLRGKTVYERVDQRSVAGA
ncbi:MAG: chemotaxis protein CheR [Aeromicrobium sp.]|nr:chemotaxis protein CheR [Burkholderiales bacterium]